MSPRDSFALCICVREGSLSVQPVGYKQGFSVVKFALQKIGSEIDFVILSKLMDLSVRPLAAEDFDGFINYWLGLSQAEIERLGVAIDRVPSAARMRSDLEAMLAPPNDGVRSFVLAWCVNGQAIGHSSLKDIVPGDFGSIHLHMWRADLRGKGHGPHLFCLAVVDFYERFKLKRIVCEPKADNAPPNRLLQRVGFPLISTRIGRSSELSRICKLNRYDIVREIAEDYLLTRRSHKNEARKGNAVKYYRKIPSMSRRAQPR